MPLTTTPPTLMPELQRSLYSVAGHPIRRQRAVRRRRWTAAMVSVVAIGVAGGAAAGVLPGQLTPEQQRAQSVVADQTLVALERLPRVGRAELPQDMRRLLEVTTPELASTARGWRLSSRPAVFVFATADGSYCVLEASGASCKPLRLLSPTFSFGYSQRDDTSSVSVVALGDVDRVRVTAEDGRQHAVDVPNGATTLTVPGRITGLSWAAAGESFSHEVPVDLSTPGL